MLALAEGTRLHLIFPVLPAAEPPKPEKPKRGRQKKAPEVPLSERFKERLFELRKHGFNRLIQQGRIFEFSTPESLLEIDFSQPLYALVDRLAIAPDIRSRLVDGIETAYREAGEAIFETAPRSAEGEIAPTPEQFRFAQRFECKQCRIRYEDPEPRLFSFNNPYGACSQCQGFGNTIDVDLNLVIPDHTKTLAEGAIEPWTKPKYRPLLTDLKRFARERGLPLDIPWQEMSEEARRIVIEGEGRYHGVRGFFAHLEKKKYKLHVRVFVSRYRGYSRCSACGGQRLRREARQVKVSGLDICAVTAMTVEQAAAFFRGLELRREENEIAGRILEEIQDRLRFLVEVGLEYLTLDRLASTLSGGEAQRIQLASALGSRLVGTLYVLDEPSIGLHPRDTHRLIKILKDLRDLGNTILVVEHDPDIMRASDRILDLGPGAGENGGRLVAAGTCE